MAKLPHMPAFRARSGSKILHDKQYITLDNSYKLLYTVYKQRRIRHADYY